MFSPEGSRAFRKFLEETVGPVMAGPQTMLVYIAANGECSDADVIKRARGAGILPLLRKLPNWFDGGEVNAQRDWLASYAFGHERRTRSRSSWLNRLRIRRSRNLPCAAFSSLGSRLGCFGCDVAAFLGREFLGSRFASFTAEFGKQSRFQAFYVHNISSFPANSA